MNQSAYKILLVDDDTDIQEFVSYNLRKESYQVFIANNGIEAIEIAKNEHPNLIILDVMMPNLNGIETCKIIRNIEGMDKVIITFLSARSEEFSQIAGYDAGADDYITKPIKPSILIKKISSLLRRANPETNTFKNIKINPDKHEVFVNNQAVVLAKKEFKLLKLLASNPDKVFNRDEIYKHVWGDCVVVGDRTIDVHVRKIRKKIGNNFIQTLKGVGYKFIDA